MEGYNQKYAKQPSPGGSAMTPPTVFRIAPHESGRLVDLRSRLGPADSGSLWDGDRLRASYASRLASGAMAVWIAVREEEDLGYAWFQTQRGEFTLKEVVGSPEAEAAVIAALIAAGLAWLRQQGGKVCRFNGEGGRPALDSALRECGFLLEEEHLQMRAGIDAWRQPDSSLQTRSFTEIGDASWLLNLVEDCLECRHAYDRQDLLDLVKRRDDLSFTAWNGEQPVGFLMAQILTGRGAGAAGPVFYVQEVGVRPAFRRQGYATQMLAEGFARGRGHGLHEARLHVLGNNQAGLGLYRKLGFAEVKRTGWWKYTEG